MSKLIETPSYEKIYRIYEEHGSISYEMFCRHRRNIVAISTIIIIYCLAGGCELTGLWVGGRTLSIQYPLVVYLSTIVIYLYFYLRFERSSLPEGFYLRESWKYLWKEIIKTKQGDELTHRILNKFIDDNSGDRSSRFNRRRMPQPLSFKVTDTRLLEAANSVFLIERDKF